MKDMVDSIADALLTGHVELMVENAELRHRIEELEAMIHEAKEIYTGMDGFIPETAPEGYQQRIMRQLYEALKGEKGP
jgi:uncharacterized protein (UPF0335 family)